MIVGTYPKIQTLYERDIKTFKIIDKLRMREFGIVNNWIISEKVDGMNIRVALTEEDEIFVGGRTNNASIPPILLNYLAETFPLNNLISCFRSKEYMPNKPTVLLFGEGYGEKIQTGGNYRKGVSFRLFDVKIGNIWLEWDSIQEIACTLGIQTVPVLGTLEDINFEEVKGKVNQFSIVAQVENNNEKLIMEGIVGRSYPLLFNRQYEKVMWKIKVKDFA